MAFWDTGGGISDNSGGAGPAGLASLTSKVWQHAEADPIAVALGLVLGSATTLISLTLVAWLIVKTKELWQTNGSSQSSTPTSTKSST
jgi:hypothetical protein